MSRNGRYRLVGFAFVWSAVATAGADVVRLKNGGEVRGELREGRKSDEPVVLTTLLGGRIVLKPSQTASVSRRPAVVEEYVTRSREIAGSLGEHWDLAEWCRERGLPRQRAEQLELVLAYDPEHTAARRALGHLRYQGEWMSRDEAMRRQGYVKHKGKYITSQELALATKTEAQREAEVAWYPKVRTAFAWANGQSGKRQTEGLQILRDIEDPDAIPALFEFVGDRNEPAWRLFFVDRMRAIAGKKPVPILVRLSLNDPLEPVRLGAFSAIDEEQHGLALPYYVEALENEENEIVQRAADALGAIGDERAVPHLIRALVTSHKVGVQVPVQDAVSVAGARGTGRYSVGGPSSYLPGNIELLLRTGQLPYGVQVIDPNTRYTTVTVSVDVRNARVLESLKRLTDGDFAYDQDAWRAYWAARQSGVGQL